MAGFKSLLGISKKKKSPSSANNSSHGGGGDAPTVTRSDSARLNQKQIEELEHVFKKFDSKGDGKICSSELKSIMSSLGQSVSEEEIVSMIREVDSDGDGFIDLREFIELNTKEVDSEEIMSCLREAFSVYDMDGNGSISAEELMEVMRGLGDECTVADCRKMISAVDSDGDGNISFEEFKI
ncbi:hypothetical protein V2J09_012702 [Rumex salicifolius]